MGLREATLEEQFWFLWSRIPSYLRKKELVALNSGKRTTVGSGGFVCKARDYDETGIITRRYLQKSRQQITFEQPSYMRKSKDAIINYNQHNPSNIIVIFIMANKEKERKLKALSLEIEKIQIETSEEMELFKSKIHSSNTNTLNVINKK